MGSEPDVFDVHSTLLVDDKFEGALCRCHHSRQDGQGGWNDEYCYECEREGQGIEDFKDGFEYVYEVGAWIETGLKDDSWFQEQREMCANWGGLRLVHVRGGSAECAKKTEVDYEDASTGTPSNLEDCSEKFDVSIDTIFSCIPSAAKRYTLSGSKFYRIHGLRRVRIEESLSTTAR